MRTQILEVLDVAGYAKAAGVSSGYTHRLIRDGTLTGDIIIRNQNGQEHHYFWKSNSDRRRIRND